MASGKKIAMWVGFSVLALITLPIIIAVGSLIFVSGDTSDTKVAQKSENSEPKIEEKQGQYFSNVSEAVGFLSEGRW